MHLHVIYPYTYVLPLKVSVSIRDVNHRGCKQQQECSNYDLSSRNSLCSVSKAGRQTRARRGAARGMQRSRKSTIRVQGTMLGIPTGNHSDRMLPLCVPVAGDTLLSEAFAIIGVKMIAHRTPRGQTYCQLVFLKQRLDPNVASPFRSLYVTAIQGH